jgi:hypothetical protein
MQTNNVNSMDEWMSFPRRVAFVNFRARGSSAEAECFLGWMPSDAGMAGDLRSDTKPLFSFSR